MHTMAHTAYILLYQRFASMVGTTGGGRDDVNVNVGVNLGLGMGSMGFGATALEKCLNAARAVAVLVKHVADSDFEFLDPIIGVSPFFSLSFC